MDIKAGDRVSKAGRKGTAVTDSHDDPYGYGIKVVTVNWDATNRKSTVYIKTLKKIVGE